MSDDTDELAAAYRRASDAEAGRPSAATRAAILAEARRLAANRTRPAANEPRFRRRAFAGIAASVLVAGIAVTLWRQTERPTQTATRAEAVSVPGAEAVPAPAESNAARQAAADDAQRSDTLLAAAESQAVAAPAPAPAPVDTRALVEREFPRLLNSGEAPRNVWLLQDAGGRTLKTGTLAVDQSFGTVTLQLQREMPDRRIEAFEVQNLATDRGTVQVGVARAR